MSEDNAQEKPFEASAQKLLEARRKGEVAKSTDLGTAAAYAGLILALLLFGSTAAKEFADATFQIYGDVDRSAAQVFGGNGQDALGDLLNRLAVKLLPLFWLPAVLAMTCYLAQRAVVFAPTKLRPKISRISLVSNAKNKFGLNGLMEFFKSILKLAAYSICLAMLLQAALPTLNGTIWMAPQIGVIQTQRTLLHLLLLAFLITLTIGTVDFFWQRHRHLTRLRMTSQEMKEEQKRTEGDPQVKQQRRQKAMEIAGSRMFEDIPTADVVIVNPTHYAVALKWNRQKGEVPICVAKGVDEVAARIRRAAMEHAVPVHSDPPTARALFASTDLGTPIPPDLYAAVAVAIRFAEAMRARAKIAWSRELR